MGLMDGELDYEMEGPVVSREDTCCITSPCLAGNRSSIILPGLESQNPLNPTLHYNLKAIVREAGRDDGVLGRKNRREVMFTGEGC